MGAELNPSKFVRLVAKAPDDNAVRDEVNKYIEQDPTLVLPVIDSLVRYFTMDTVRELVGRIIKTEDPKKFVKYIPEIGPILEDPDRIRNLFLDYHQKSPWVFYCYKDYLRNYFSPGYFDGLLAEGVNFFENPQLFAIYRLFFADVPIEAQPDRIQKILHATYPERSETNITVYEGKDPGFACGGLEKNYLEARQQGTGWCIVNDEFMAKKFHRKGDAKKVTLVPQFTLSNGSAIVWADHVYAPSGGTHVLIEEALVNDEKTLTLPHLPLRPVRPLIGLTSTELFAPPSPRSSRRSGPVRL